MAELTVKLNKKGITINLPLSILKIAAEHSEYFGEQELRICDEEEFAKDVLYELLREEEDGSTPVIRMFDAAFEAAADQGSLGVYGPDDE